MKTACIFPGQASQFVGMGFDFYQKYSLAKKMFDKADEALGYSISEKCFQGPLADLTETRFTQPAIFTVSAIISEIIRKEYAFNCQAGAGHSLGEYSALYSAGVFSFEEALKLVKLRAENMQAAGVENPGTMAAILNLEAKLVMEACQRAAEYGIVQIANYNSPNQIAISGESSAVLQAMKLAKEMGASRVIQLEVGGAFHSPLMSAATQELALALETFPLEAPTFPIYANIDALPTRSIEKIRKNLILQIEKPVLWENIIENMIQDGFTHFVEIGPGKVLQGLIKRINPDVSVNSIGTVAELENIQNEHKLSK
ncbi:MAG TPA: [acyl-carrier-protein] S-malonyltransferase [Candidatus Marinimicrobia bacterium]|nr:[acyl-carrier-protein] S-malonyltransferase [Candidatus Neomarinimicrobiota bacterium]